MKGRTIEPVMGNHYYYVDLMADDLVSHYPFRGSELDYQIQNRRLIFYDYDSAKATADALIEYIKTITE
jgi:hypothetical protein